eukprot:TRINITY_DN4449_c0_g1_i13.p1 TRINITY_DN4449_c0_g1~~TRINITY_DN4449_c0_g1_i13.p1  ORF type:complete len:271 (-),score=56.61 TRINITY_DN4449_c0_g1_i13:237-1049(-)
MKDDQKVDLGYFFHPVSLSVPSYLLPVSLSPLIQPLSLVETKKISESQTKFYSAQIVCGLEYLHSLGIIYRDLKPENLLLKANGYIVMTDFGLTKEGLCHPESRTSTFCGTPEYLSPEVLRGEEYTKSVDWWSLGIVIYEMLTGFPPFYDDDEVSMYHKILTMELVIPSYFTIEVANMVASLLSRDLKTRLQGVNQIKSHQWFKDLYWEDLLKEEIPAPFLPTVKGPGDVQNIRRELLCRSINRSLHMSSTVGQEEDGDDQFFGFTYQSS